ncbi:hypothetical protein [Undibacterium sp. TJN19]|uniref:hypothetical protein n=1 Tax=Undibacterium sp. TJN19 TaxID=3413055 RepID=UPI003BF51BC8
MRSILPGRHGQAFSKENFMVKKIVFLALFICVQAGLTACSVAYDLQQDAAERQCEKIMDWNERKTCLQQNKTTYEQYEKQREDLRTKGTEKK